MEPRFQNIGGLRDETFKSLPAEIAEPYLLHEGDVLLARSGATVGKSFIYSEEWGTACFAGYLIRARLRPSECLPTWLSYFCQTDGYWGYVAGSQIQATIQNVSAEKYANLYLPLPPLDEQKAISSFLDVETSKIDGLVSEQRRLIELLKEKRQAVISHAVTKGLNPNAPMKPSGIQWLGDVVQHWEVYRMGVLYSDTSESGNDDLPVLQVSIHHGVSDRELTEDESDRKITRIEDKSKYRRVLPNDLVYNMMRAWQGGFGTVKVKGMVSPAYVVARPKRDFITQYVEHLFRTPQAIEQMRRYSHGVTDFRLRLYPLRTLVAFSGEVNDKESGPDPFKETSTELNPNLKGRNIAEAFKDDQFQILLVANKFQTGFDQPLLCGMYVDKRLAGIQAVQTLSRLNRCYPGKDNTYVLDFVNEPSEVLDAFKTYFTTAQLSDATDPNIILDLRTKLDALGYYDEHEIDRVVKVVLDPSSKQKHLEAAITPVADRLLKKFAAAKAAHAEAVENKDDKAAQAAKDTMDALVLFRSDITTYLRAYTFLSQIFDYGNTDFEKRALFFKYLVRLLKFGREREGVDLSEVTLTHHKLSNRGKRDLGLSDEDAPKLNPMTEIGSGAVREKQNAYLTEIISKLNEIYGTDTTDGDQLSHATTLNEKVLESTVLQQQAANNSKEQFANSPDLTNEIMNAIIDAMDVQTELSTKALNSAKIRDGLKQILLNQLGLYEKLKSRATGARA